MTKRIFRSTFAVAAVVLLASFVLITGVLYEYFSNKQMDQLNMQTHLAAQGVESAGAEYFSDMNIDGCRITWIAADGTVLFDSITACLSERMFPDGTPNARAGREITGELLTVSRSCGHFIAVCDDLWHGGEDYQDWTEVYVRELAEICRALASEFDAVCEMTAGLPRLWKGELPRV